MSNKINIKQITVDISNQIKTETSYQKHVNKLNKGVKLNNENHTKYYKKYKKMAEIQIELFKGIIETAGYLKKNNVLQKNKDIAQLASLGKKYIAHVNSFKGISNYTNAVVGHKLLMLSFSKEGLTTHLHMLERTINMLKQASDSIKEENSKYKDQIVTLTESTDVFLEADAIKTLKNIGSKFLKAIKTTFSALVEGWMFILKEMKPVVQSIKAQINKINKAYNDNFVKGAKFVLNKLNPNMLEDAVTLLGDDAINDAILKFGNMAILGISSLLGFTAIPIALSALKSVEVGLDYALKASEVAEVGTFIQDAINMGADFDGLDDL